MPDPTPSATSPFVAEIAPIDCTDDEIRGFLADAELQPLLPALAYATGDMSLLRDDLQPDPLLLALPAGGFTDEQAAAIRALALETLIAFRDGGCVAAPPPSDADVLRIMSHAVGGFDVAAYLPLLEEELSHRGEDRRGPTWRKDEVAPDADFRVLVIGAGMSGLLAGHRLAQAGVDFLIVDKNEDVGGTWYENSYPGCRVDNPNHNFSYSFAQRHDWPFHYSTQPVLHGYFRDCADAFGLRDGIRFRTEVQSATWSDDDERWTVELRGPDGDETVVVDAVISAVGQLNRPHMPEIPGVGTFAGPAFHSARWRHDVDLTGKRVAVIGTGASAMQLDPRDRRRRRRAAGVPAHPGVDGADARVPRRRARRADLALPARALVQRVQPVLHLLEDGRRGARERARRSRLGPARLGRTDERHGADAVHRVPEGRVRRPARPARGVHPHLPGRRQADDPRQRRVGAGAQARQRPPAHERHRRDHGRRHRGGRRRSGTTSTSSSTARGSPPRSSSPR